MLVSEVHQKCTGGLSVHQYDSLAAADLLGVVTRANPRRAVASGGFHEAAHRDPQRARIYLRHDDDICYTSLHCRLRHITNFEEISKPGARGLYGAF